MRNSVYIWGFTVLSFKAWLGKIFFNVFSPRIQKYNFKASFVHDGHCFMSKPHAQLSSRGGITTNCKVVNLVLGSDSVGFSTLRDFSRKDLPLWDLKHFVWIFSIASEYCAFHSISESPTGNSYLYHQGLWLRLAEQYTDIQIPDINISIYVQIPIYRYKQYTDSWSFPADSGVQVGASTLLSVTSQLSWVWLH